MNRFKYQAFMDEFPGVERLAWGNVLDCDSIKVKRMDEALMDHVPHYDGATGSLVGIEDKEVISFVLHDGSLIEDAVSRSGYVVHNEAHRDNEEWEGETVLEAIDRHQVADRLLLIVSVEAGYNILDHHSQRNWRMTLYKPSESLSIKQAIRNARDQARERVQIEGAF